MLPGKIHRYIFIFSTALLVISLPTSIFLLSISQLILALNWVTELQFKRKFHQILHSRPLQLVLSIYILHIIFLLNTSNFDYALHDLRIKLPLLALPLIYGTTSSLNKKEFRIILQLFAASVLVSSFITSFVILGFTQVDVVDSRYASLFISHIRFALLVVLSIYTLLYFLLFSEWKLSTTERIIYLVAAVWLSVFLVILQSFTGVVIFVCLAPVTLLWWAVKQSRRSIFWLSLIVSLSIPLVMGIYLFRSAQRFSEKNVPVKDELPEYTVNGNPYQHNLSSEEYENGNHVYSYISEEELIPAWNRVSEFEYHGVDRKGQRLSTTLLRYLSSLGYKKDSLGITKLTPEDIEMVEKGYTNYIFKNRLSIYPRVYELLWEIEQYRKTENPSGHSLAQRIEYIKTGLRIAQNNFWFGVGTGDVQDAFHKQYVVDDSKLQPQWRHRTHNQYLTFLISFGIFGLLWFLYALIGPVILLGKASNYYFMMFFLIGLLSMMNEDTLETHVGVSFFAFFLAFTLFSMPNKDAADATTKIEE